MRVCMSLQHLLCFHTLAKLVTPHMKRHSMLQSLSCCRYMQCSWQLHHKKHKIRYLSINTIMTSHKLTHNSHTSLPQYQQNKINIFWKNLRLLSLAHDHSHETAAELCSIKHFTLQTLHYITK